MFQYRFLNEATISTVEKLLSSSQTPIDLKHFDEVITFGLSLSEMEMLSMLDPGRQYVSFSSAPLYDKLGDSALVLTAAYQNHIVTREPLPKATNYSAFFANHFDNTIKQTVTQALIEEADLFSGIQDRLYLDFLDQANKIHVNLTKQPLGVVNGFQAWAHMLQFRLSSKESSVVEEACCVLYVFKEQKGFNTYECANNHLHSLESLVQFLIQHVPQP